MNKLALFALAAGAAVLPVTASAQVVTHPGTNVVVRQHGGFTAPPGFFFMHPGPNFPHHRLQTGFFIHPFFFGPQFHIQNWQLYGFPPPPRHHRWVRHYDDAYLIDGDGRVRDHRYGLDWDEYGERWEMDDGIPSYYGRGDWRPGEEDYAWFERHGYGRDRRGERDYADDRDGYRRDRRGDYADDRDGYGPPPGAMGYHPQMPQACGYGPAYNYGGYGYGVAYPIVIETTVVTGGGCGCTEEVIEEVIEVRERPRRYRHRRPAPRRHSAPPPAGERG